VLHGPHHCAPNSTSTGSSLRRISISNVCSETLVSAIACTIYSLHGPWQAAFGAAGASPPLSYGSISPPKLGRGRRNRPKPTRPSRCRPYFPVVISRNAALSALAQDPDDQPLRQHPQGQGCPQK